MSTIWSYWRIIFASIVKSLGITKLVMNRVSIMVVDFSPLKHSPWKRWYFNSSSSTKFSAIYRKIEVFLSAIWKTRYFCRNGSSQDEPHFYCFKLLFPHDNMPSLGKTETVSDARLLTQALISHFFCNLEYPTTKFTNCPTRSSSNFFLFPRVWSPFEFKTSFYHCYWSPLKFLSSYQLSIFWSFTLSKSNANYYYNYYRYLEKCLNIQNKSYISRPGKSLLCRWSFNHISQHFRAVTCPSFFCRYKFNLIKNLSRQFFKIWINYNKNRIFSNPSRNLEYSTFYSYRK